MAVAEQPRMLSPEEEQDKLLNDASMVVKSSAYHMKKALDQNKLKDALKHASAMLSELRTGSMSPKNYYDLYMKVFNELSYLEQYFREANKSGTRMIDLYELVQHATQIIPRLYLLITVGSVYIRSKEAPAREVLRDLVEMCRGVQHPTRGLFLRSYLSQLTKDKLPDRAPGQAGNEYEGEGGSVKDSIEFVLSNFLEMNKLWVRMQHQGPLREREKRERERKELRQLVGSNLVRLSQIEGVDLETYKTQVLPRITEQIVTCKDPIAQEYLMDIIIQAFPDEFHLETLQAFLGTCAQLQQGVDIRAVLVNLMDRLAKYAAQNGISEEYGAFGQLSENVAKIVNAQGNLELAAVLSLQVALLNFALKCYPDRLEYVDQILGQAAVALSSIALRQLEEGPAVRNLVQLLTTPLASYKARVLTILELKNFSALLAYLPFKTRKTVATSLLQAVVRNRSAVEEPSKVEVLFEFVRPLTADGEGPGAAPAPTRTPTRTPRTPDPATLFAMYSSARKHVAAGGPRRIKFTLPPLIFSLLKLAPAIRAKEAAGEEVTPKTADLFKFVLQTALPLVQVVPNTALRLFLQCAQAAARCGVLDFAYEFLTQAFVVFEEEIADSKQQFAALTLIIGSLTSLEALGAEDYESAAVKCVQSCTRLLKKPDQCRCTYLASHLFWRPAELQAGGFPRDGRRVLECLKKAVKVAEGSALSGSPVQLLVELLNQALYYFDAGAEAAVTPAFLNQLLDSIKEHAAGAAPALEPATLASYQNTLALVRAKKAAPETAERYKELLPS
eukprot:tig00001086_g6856.t1